MRTITEIRKIGKGLRYYLYLDNEFFGIYEAEILARYCLKTGDKFEDDFFEKLKIENGDFACFNRGLNVIEKSLKSEKMLYKYLKEKSYPDECIERAIYKLKSYGYIDDGAFCENYINSYPMKSRKKLKYDLLTKGIDIDLVEKKLNENLNSEMEEEKSFIEAQRYLKNKIYDLKTKQKFYNHMLSKGFDYSQIQKAWEEIVNGRS